MKDNPELERKGPSIKACPECGCEPEPHWVELKGQRVWRLHCPDVFEFECSHPIKMQESPNVARAIRRWNKAVEIEEYRKSLNFTG